MVALVDEVKPKMIIDHTHPLYVKKRNSMTKDGKYNGAYYYSREIVMSRQIATGLLSDYQK